jgi:hypothetical protein
MPDTSLSDSRDWKKAEVGNAKRHRIAPELLNSHHRLLTLQIRKACEGAPRIGTGKKAVRPSSTVLSGSRRNTVRHQQSMDVRHGGILPPESIPKNPRHISHVVVSRSSQISATVLLIDLPIDDL